jgi:AcrR family transcriptional regulator
VLVAALEVLADRGLAGFTMEAVAHRAGASKATVYRRWRSSGELLIDAMDATFRPFPSPTTGNVRSGLIEILSGFERLLDGPFPLLLAAFMDAAERDPGLKSLHAELTGHRREPLRALLIRAREQGQISAAADVELAVDLLGGPLFYRHFVAHRAYPEGYAVAVIDHVLTALGYTEWS